MHVLCAPDSFKESLAAAAAATAMADGARRAHRTVAVSCCPVADGGDGSLEVLAAALDAEVRTQHVTGPLGEPVRGRYAVASNGIGVVAIADASGLALIPPARRDPLRTSSYGTGELIGACTRSGCRRVIVCLGGSATVDGGAAIAQALGAKFLDETGAVIEKPMTGATIGHVASFEPPAHLPEIVACCDVTSPLLGPQGAAAVYGPQKGASAEQVCELEAGLAHLARVIGGDPETPGAGSAGGAGWGLATMCGAGIEGGAKLVLDFIGFDKHLDGCDLVLTGEGALDAQTLAGKAPMEVARRAVARGIPVVAIVGRLGPGAGGPFDEIVSLLDQYGETRAVNDTVACLTDAATKVVAARINT